MFELNLPNVLTLLRILLVPVLVAALVQEGGGGDKLAAAVFVLASATDALDGWIARRNRSVTNFGKLMDPLADKLLVTAALVSLVSLDRVAAWVAMVIIAREFAVTGLRLVAAAEDIIISAGRFGKAKALSQNVALGAIILPGFPAGVADVLLGIALVLTVLSGIHYFLLARWRLFSGKGTVSADAVEEP